MPAILRGAVMDPTINTVDGKLFSYRSLDFSELTVYGMVSALAKICRFTGHCTEFYSVAEHCVIASHLVPRPVAVCALIHDLHECVVGDMNSPLKSMSPEYKALEKATERSLQWHLGVVPLPPDKKAVKKADTLLYLAERETIMPQLPQTHPEHGYIPLPPVGTNDYDLFVKAKGMIQCLDWREARDLYMARWKELQR